VANVVFWCALLTVGGFIALTVGLFGKRGRG
jgi:hypothetical protein